MPWPSSPWGWRRAGRPCSPRPRARASARAGAGEARADLVDRDGRLLAVDLTHFGLYLDPREIADKDEIRHDLAVILPRLPRDRLEKALASNRREYLVGA